MKDEPGHETTDSIFINRTNNPLEPFKRTFGEVIGMYPNMVVFIKGILKIMENYLDMMKMKIIHHKIIKKPKKRLSKSNSSYTEWRSGFEDDNL